MAGQKPSAWDVAQVVRRWVVAAKRTILWTALVFAFFLHQRHASWSAGGECSRLAYLADATPPAAAPARGVILVVDGLGVTGEGRPTMDMHSYAHEPVVEARVATASQHWPPRTGRVYFTGVPERVAGQFDDLLVRARESGSHVHFWSDPQSPLVAPLRTEGDAQSDLRNHEAQSLRDALALEAEPTVHVVHIEGIPALAARHGRAADEVKRAFLAADEWLEAARAGVTGGEAPVIVIGTTGLTPTGGHGGGEWDARMAAATFDAEGLVSGRSDVPLDELDVAPTIARMLRLPAPRHAFGSPSSDVLAHPPLFGTRAPERREEWRRCLVQREFRFIPQSWPVTGSELGLTFLVLLGLVLILRFGLPAREHIPDLRYAFLWAFVFLVIDVAASGRAPSASVLAESPILGPLRTIAAGTCATLVVVISAHRGGSLPRALSACWLLFVVALWFVLSLGDNGVEPTSAFDAYASTWLFHALVGVGVAEVLVTLTQRWLASHPDDEEPNADATLTPPDPPAS